MTDTVSTDSDDLSNLYVLRTADRSRFTDAAHMEEWLRSYSPGKDGAVAEAYPARLPDAEQERPHELPAPKPTRRKASDELGTPEPQKEPGAVATVTKNLAEIPKQTIAGIDDAARHVFQLPFMSPLNDLGNFINSQLPEFASWGKMAEPKTGTGAFTRKISEFLTGFIPAIRGLRALGATGTVAPTILAAAVSDFAVRDPHEGRLSDLWKEAGLPDNVLTDYLASDENDTDSEARMKNAAESVLTGVALEGVLLGARAIRAVKQASREAGANKAEIDYLRAKYGEVVDPADTAPLTRVVVEGFEGGESTTYSLITPKSTKGKWKVVQDESMGDKTTHEFATREEAQKFLEKTRADTHAEITAGDAAQGTTLRVERERLGSAEKELSNVYKRVVGDPSKPAIEIRVREPSPAGRKIKAGMEDTEDLGARALIRGNKKNGLPDDFEVYINFQAFDTPDKVKFVIGKMAEALKGKIDEARRGVITHAETQEMADKLGMTVTDLLGRRKGIPLNAEEALAARNLWTASAEQLLELAKKANMPNAGPLDVFAFRKSMAVHAAIQSEVMGARTETARALNAWKIDATGGVERARAIQQVLGAMGGPKESAEMARRIAILADVGDPAVLARIVDRGWGATSVDAFREIWVNGLLSSPKTHAVNIMSNTLVAFQQIYERGAASGIRALTGGEGVEAGEAAAMAFGLTESIKDAFRMAAKALKTGESGHAFNKIDTPRVNAVSADAFRMSKETGMGRFVDFLGTATNVPGRLLGAEDEFFKTIGYRMELRAQALRTAKQEGLNGRPLAERIDDLMRNPSEALRINSADAALYSTFTNEMGSFGRAIMNLRNIDHPLNPLMFVLPFVRTPVNIARYAFERTPFAPLVSQWRADIAAGGARADLALARMSTGTAIMAAGMDFADSGFISGDGPRGDDKEIREAMMRQGWKPYSIKIGDDWYSYNRLDPLGMTLGFAASISETIRKGEISEERVDEWHEVTAMAIAAVAQVSISKTYLEGFAKLVEVLSDPKRYTKQYIQDLMASFTPMTGAMGTIKNYVDPVQREAGNPAEAVMARIAGLSEQLTPRRDLWGKEITSTSGLGKLYDAVSPVAVSPGQDSPIDQQIVRLNMGPNRITTNPIFDGVQTNLRNWPKVYDEYTRLAGNDLKHPAWGLGAHDFLNKVVSGQHPLSASWNFMSDDAQRKFIQSTMTDYRHLAQQQILSDPKFHGFAKEVQYLKQRNQDARMPVLGEQQ